MRSLRLAGARRLAPSGSPRAALISPLALPFFLVFALAATAAARAESPWGALLRNDAKALHDTVLADHPGAVDPLNPGFKTWLEEGYRQALERAGRCDSWDGYRFALQAYANGFHDGHLGVGFALRRDVAAWPGFVAGWRDGKIAVHSVAAEEGWKDLPPAGSTILSCDGTPALDRVRRDVFPFDGKLDLEADWARTTPFLFLDRHNPWRAPLPKSCRFGTPAGEREIALQFREIAVDTVWPRIVAARSATSQPFAVRDFGARGVWISIPTFEASGESEAKLQDLVARAPSWKDRDPIVLDVRGNGGGNSRWGEDLVTGLYGKDFLQSLGDGSGGKTYVEWRASQRNLAHVESVVPMLEEQFGADSEGSQWIRGIRDGLRQAVAGGRPLFRETSTPAGAPKAPARTPANPVAGRIFLLTDGSCGSACLDFCDLVRALPNATHVGRQTFADSLYMELREEPLPSGVATLGLPIKVYRDRLRGNNEPYTPQIPFPGDIADTAALETWVAGLAAAPPHP